MIHTLMLAFALIGAWGWRCLPYQPDGSWQARWQRAIGQFVGPPLLLLVTGLAVLGMGRQGEMAGAWQGQIGYDLAVAGLGFSLVLGIYLAGLGWRSLHRMQTYPQVEVAGQTLYLLESPSFFAAQVGFWQSYLLVSRGLWQGIPPQHMQAILSHEQAHHHYRDPFCFFGLGWLRRLTPWLPQTQLLWGELVLLRELRADRWAARQVDPLTLAEAMLMVSADGVPVNWPECVAFASAMDPHHRLQERIQALLIEGSQTSSKQAWWQPLTAWGWLVGVAAPLLSLPFHHAS
ncbi:MAG: M56 family metallopeptidase [Cyanobacteriota bacterium]|nr:M56 family metallopeptidase [Cyanobacteriota bacterium]